VTELYYTILCGGTFLSLFNIIYRGNGAGDISLSAVFYFLLRKKDKVLRRVKN
jgi:hypothetical protein